MAYLTTILVKDLVYDLAAKLDVNGHNIEETYATKEALSTSDTNISSNTKTIATLKSLIEIINGDSTTEGSYRKAIKDLIGGAPEAYDTLKEIADKLATDDDLHTTILNALTEKASLTDLTAAVKRIATTESDIATLETSKDVTVTVTDLNYSTLYTIKLNKAAIQNVEVPKAASVKNNTLYL